MSAYPSKKEMFDDDDERYEDDFSDGLPRRVTVTCNVCGTPDESYPGRVCAFCGEGVTQEGTQ